MSVVTNADLTGIPTAAQMADAIGYVPMDPADLTQAAILAALSTNPVFEGGARFNGAPDYGGGYSPVSSSGIDGFAIYPDLEDDGCVAQWWGSTSGIEMDCWGPGGSSYLPFWLYAAGFRLIDYNDIVLLDASEKGIQVPRVFIVGTTAPADGDLAANQCAIWFDPTDGAAALMVKAKQANGTVKTGTLAVTT